MLKPFFILLLLSPLWALAAEVQWAYQDKVFSLFTNLDLAQTQQQVEQVIVTVHGSERNADTYFNSMIGVTKLAGLGDQSLVIAPHFKLATDALLAQEFSWDDEGWLKGDQALNQASVSSFELLEAFIKEILQKGQFPNLKTVIFTGHSAGAQMVQRFAGGNSLDQQFKNIHFRYVVTNPGSYLYLTSERPFGPQLICAFNDYKYGLDHLNSYMSKKGAGEIVSQYLQKDVVYLLGEADIRSDDIDQSCPAQFQGPFRLQRGLSYKEQLDRHFPQHQHHLFTVPGVGHTQYGMYHSENGLKALFQKL